MQRRIALSTLILAGAALSAACSPTPFHAPAAPTAEQGSPLGPSYVLLPLPSEDEALLGRVLPELPAPGRSLEETSRPNPCAESLTAIKTTPLASTFEDAQEIAARAQAKAMLGTFGFEGDAQTASHFFYKINTEKRVSVTDTTPYVECCAKKGGCGVGFVSALIHGDGEYATGEESAASGAVTVPLAGGAGGGVQLKILHRRKVKGYLAALVTLTGKQTGPAVALGPLGVEAAEPPPSQRVLEAYERDKVSITMLPNNQWVLRTGTEFLTENEFARRYEKETSSPELRPVDSRRNWVSTIVLGALTAGSVYATYWGITNLKRNCRTDDVECWNTSTSINNPAPNSPQGTAPKGGQCVDASCAEYINPDDKVTNPVGIIALTIGATVAIPMTTAFIWALVVKDGSPVDHVLTEDDARKYTTRYNRAILRRSNLRIQREMDIERGAKLEWKPMLGPGVLGFGATF